MMSGVILRIMLSTKNNEKVKYVSYNAPKLICTVSVKIGSKHS